MFVLQPEYGDRVPYFFYTAAIFTDCIIRHNGEVYLQYWEVLMFLGYASWCWEFSVTLLLFVTNEASARNWPKTCVPSSRLTMPCALCIALTEWHGPACVNTLCDLTKTLKHFIFLPQHKTYKLFDNIIEGAWQWPIYLFFIFYFKCANVDYIFIPVADTQVPRRYCYKSYMSKLKFSNIIWNILWQSSQAHTKWIMEITKAQSEYGIRYILVVWTRVNFQSPGT